MKPLKVALMLFPLTTKELNTKAQNIFPCKYLTKTEFIRLLINLLILNDVLQRPSYYVN